jgi:hypothetical protein
MIHDSLLDACSIMQSHGFGRTFHLQMVFKRLNELGLDLKHQPSTRIITSRFLENVRNCALQEILRGLKHDARIPVPGSYSFAGGVDEGPAYRARGVEHVYCLKTHHIFGARSAVVVVTTLTRLCSLRTGCGPRRANISRRELRRI